MPDPIGESSAQDQRESKATEAALEVDSGHSGAPAMVPDAAVASQSGQWQVLANGRRARLTKFWPWLLGTVVALILVAAALALLELRLLTRTGVVTHIERGQLEVQDGQNSPWFSADAGRVVRPGARLRSGGDTVASIAFFDSTVMRVESRGNWQVVELRGNRNGWVSRVTIRQLEGSASFASRPPGSGYPLLLTSLNHRLLAQQRIEVSGAMLELVGVARIRSGDDGSTQVSIVQGDCRIVANNASVLVVAGQSALIKPEEGIWVDGREQKLF